MKPYLIASFFAVAIVGLSAGLISCLTGCAAQSPTSSTSPSATTTNIENALPLVRTGASVATGAVLNFAVKDTASRTKLANEMYASANAIYSMTGTGTFPTVSQFQTAILAFGGSAADANYAQYSSAVASLYASYYPKLVANPDIKTATDLLNAIAGGIEDATLSYVTIPPTAVSINDTPQTNDGALKLEQRLDRIRHSHYVTAGSGFQPPRFKVTTGLRPIFGWRDPYNVQLASR